MAKSRLPFREDENMRRARRGGRGPQKSVVQYQREAKALDEETKEQAFARYEAERLRQLEPKQLHLFDIEYGGWGFRKIGTEPQGGGFAENTAILWARQDQEDLNRKLRKERTSWEPAGIW